MKYMVISDIHGGIYELNNALNIYFEEKCEKLIVLGDLFSYGFSIDRDDIINRLNLMKDNIIAVRGNCDYNINGINFDMPYIKEVVLNNKKILISHGHIYDLKALLNMKADIILLGHTHISRIDKIDNTYIVNPGSLSKSRSGENSFAIIDDEKITIRNLDNQIINSLNINA